jgi:hypothetical protein
MWHLCGRREMVTGFQQGNLKERGHLQDLGIVGREYENGSSKNRMELFGLDSLAQNLNSWQTFVNIIINYEFDKPGEFNYLGMY